MVAGYQAHPHNRSALFPWISEQALPPVYVSHESSLLNSGSVASIDDMSVLWRKGVENNGIIVCLTQGEMGTDVFILERCIDGCSLYIQKMGEVSFDSRSMTLIDRCFWGGRGRNGKCLVLLTGIWVPWSPLWAKLRLKVDKYTWSCQVCMLWKVSFYCRLLYWRQCGRDTVKLWRHWWL